MLSSSLSQSVSSQSSSRRGVDGNDGDGGSLMFGEQEPGHDFSSRSLSWFPWLYCSATLQKSPTTSPCAMPWSSSFASVSIPVSQSLSFSFRCAFNDREVRLFVPFRGMGASLPLDLRLRLHVIDELGLLEDICRPGGKSG